MLIARVIDHELGHDAQPAAVRFLQEDLEIGERAVARIDGRVVGDVVAVIAQRRGIEGQQPEDVDAEVLKVIELAGQPLKITDAVAIAVEKRADVRLVDDPVFVPKVVHKELRDEQ